QPLQDSPYWFVDTTENEYLHVISYNENRSSTGLPTLKTGEVYVKRYVRASRIDNVDVCLEIITRSGSMRDTCINGQTVQLQAVAPVVIDSSDFELQHVATLMSNHNRHLQQKYLKVRDPRLAVGLKIEGVVGSSAEDYYPLDSSQNIVRDYQLWDDRSAYVGAWILKPNDYRKVRFGSLNGNYIDANITNYNDTNIVGNIIHYETHEERILAGRRECWWHSGGYYPCTSSIYSGNVYWEDASLLHEMYVHDKVPARVNVTDRFGNQGYFTLDYPNRGDDLVLR
ncbi:hypothetical protein, partial [Vibrio aestuarianus]